MKHLILIITIALILIGCEEDNSPSEGYPAIHNLNFELLRSDGSVYENGEVEISSLPFGINVLENNEFSWLGMGKILTEEALGSGKILFGEPCGGAPNCPSDFTSLEFASSAENVDINGPVPFEKDKYKLLRYANQDVDTLRIHDVQTTNPYHRTFSFFINEQEIEATNIIYDEYVITIQK